MYRLIIVDDEELELEGMTRFISWSSYNAEVVGTAENGQQAMELIHKHRPDIVITDIQMPVMNGLELIARLRGEDNQAEVIVLSGYGDYEYTSKAMEYGIRHYIMKPFDEGKIASVMEKVEREIERKRSRASYDHTVQKLLPKAKEQVFRDMLLKRSTDIDYGLLLEEIGSDGHEVCLLAFRKTNSAFDELEQFVAGNILGELLGRKTMPLSAQIRNDLLFLIVRTQETPFEVIRRVLSELHRLDRNKITAAVSRNGNIEDAARLYEQVEYLFSMMDMFKGEDFLSYDVRQADINSSEGIFDYKGIQAADSLGQIVFLIYSGYLKMEACGYDLQQMRDLSMWLCRLFFGEEEIQDLSQQVYQAASMEELYKIPAKNIAEKKGILLSDKESRKIQDILYALYDNLKNQNLNAKYLSNEVLFINEDYFSRLYSRLAGAHFTANLNRTRIRLVKELLNYDPEMRLTDIAEMVGFASDGQYLAKSFRKLEGITPSEYREIARQKKSDLTK